MSTPPIDVLFRRFRNAGAVIAVFPGLAAGNSWSSSCMSYQSGKGFAPCMVTICDKARAAKKEEYASTLFELEKAGYILNVVNSFRARHLTERKMKVEAQNG